MSADKYPEGHRNLADVVDDVVAALRRRNPVWITMYATTLPLHVASMLHDGRIHARESAEREGDDMGYWESGGVRVIYDRIGDTTTVYVNVGTQYESPDDD